MARRLSRYRDYWLGFAVSRAKLSWFRLAFFSLLGIDAFLQVSHAPRYGAGGFNVAHMAQLDAVLPEPSRSGMLVVFLLMSYLGLAIAAGAGRGAIWLLTPLYGYAYFISQLDSYQHHYLVFLILLLCCFVPFSASKSAAPASWALRLVMVQVAIVYLWAGLAKLAPLWRDGTALAMQLGPASGRSGWVADAIDHIGADNAAGLILVVELYLALGWLIPRLWLPTLLVGVALHIGIELAGFHIGIFSYFMFALYLLLVPDRLIDRMASRLAAPLRISAALGSLSRRPSGAIFWIATLAAIGAGTAVLAILPFDEVSAVMALVSLFAAVGIAQGCATSRGRRAAMAVAAVHVVACSGLAAIHLGSDQAHDYYKFWGGSSRRLGNWPEAKIAYDALTRLSPDHAPGHYHRARIADREGRIEQALAGYKRAEKANPNDYRAFLAEALIHHRAGRGADVLTAVNRVIALSPANKRDLEQARALHRRWSKPGADR
ncbi:MAG: HTTM domain-containing protein [Proteobacteria bacterium]|nr:HTTM domain-containing protein [Pseudomonadota bacterium]